MFPRPLLRYELAGDSVEPAYLDERCSALIRALLLHYESFVGKRFRDLEGALERLPQLLQEEARLVAGLRRVIEESMQLKVVAPCEPSLIRGAVFELGRRDRDLDPEEVFKEAGEKLGLPGDSLGALLYADLRGERALSFKEALPAIPAVISRYNFRLLQGLLLHSQRLRIDLHGEARSVYRFAKLHGLLVEVKDPGRADSLQLEITGPLSIFRHTLKYGHALARFIPACCAAGRFRLEAWLVLRDRPGRLVATQSDRVLATHRPPRAFDSRVETRFFQDFSRLGSRWAISREAQLVPTAAGVFLPDFSFHVPAEPALRVDLEIIGFWTRDYLERKRALIGSLSRERKLILCVDRRLSCDGQELPYPCIPFTGRVPAEKVLEVLDRIRGGPQPSF